MPVFNVDSKYSYEKATETPDVNYRRVRQVCELFLSKGKMAPNSRLSHREREL
jgi:hypothetical protein